MFTIKLFLALMPIIVLGIILYKIDKDKEPKKLLNKIFITSILVGLLGGLLSSALNKYLETLTFNSVFVYNVVKLLFVVALIEEVCKFIPAKFIGMKSKYHTSFYDTLFYFAISGLGFACIENIMYVMSFTVKTALVRGILSVPCHILFSLILGLFIALANKEKLKNNNKSNDKSIIYTTIGFTIASVSHAIFNYGLAQTGITKAIVVFIMYLIGIYMILILKEVSRVNTFYINNELFKRVLDFKYIKANRRIIGIISSLIIILAILNTFSVYVFAEQNIYLKYLLILVQIIFIVLLVLKNKLSKYTNIVEVSKIIIFIITIIIYIFLLTNHLDLESKIDYGYSLYLLGIFLQLTYYILKFIKLDKPVLENKEPKEEIKDEVKEDNNVDPEII